jgi:hypothetical protein
MVIHSASAPLVQCMVTCRASTSVTQGLFVAFAKEDCRMGRTSKQLVLGLAFVAVWLGASAGVARAQGAPGDSVQSAIAINDVTVAIEGDRGSSVTTFRITASPPSTQLIIVILSTRDVTATSNSNRCGPPFDYLSQTNVGVSIAPGDSAVDFVIPICGDGADEVDETFEVNLSSPTSNAVIVDPQGIGTIIDDDAAPTLSIRDASIREGDAGTSNLEFTVDLSNASGKPVSVDCGTANATATGGATCTAPADFLDLNSTLTFLPGVTSQVFSVSVCGDTDVERNEEFFVNLSNASNATITVRGQRATGIIRNDDHGKP